MIKIRVLKMPNVREIQRFMLAYIEAELVKQAQWGIKVLQADIRDWDNRTKMYYNVKVVPGKWRMEIRHNSKAKAGKLFDWTDLGTVPHVIRPKGPYPLRFKVPHSPKTLAPNQSLPTGTPVSIHALSVNHPGTNPRLFTAELADKYRSNGVLAQGVRYAARKGLESRP